MAVASNECNFGTELCTLLSQGLLASLARTFFSSTAASRFSLMSCISLSWVATSFSTRRVSFSAPSEEGARRIFNEARAKRMKRVKRIEWNDVSLFVKVAVCRAISQDSSLSYGRLHQGERRLSETHLEVRQFRNCKWRHDGGARPRRRRARTQFPCCLLLGKFSSRARVSRRFLAVGLIAPAPSEARLCDSHF